MDNADLSFLDQEPDATDPTPDAQVTADPSPQVEGEPTNTAADPAPADQGKGDPAAPPAAQGQQEQRFVPLPALLDERFKRDKAEREAEELRRWKAEQEARREAPKVPDFFENPDDRLAYERQNFQAALWNERLNMSELIARQAHGDDTVNAAREAFMQAASQNPALAMELRGNVNPYGFVVSWHKRQRAIAEIGDDPDAFRTKLEADIRAKVLAELQAQTTVPTTTRPVPPPSMAGLPGAGKATQQPVQSGFDREFGG